MDDVVRWWSGQRETRAPADAGGAQPVGALGTCTKEFSQSYHPGRILLKTNESWSGFRVAQALDVSEGTVFRIKRRIAADGLAGVV